MATDTLTGRMLGEFTLLDRLDEGGCGAVYRARQDGLGRLAVVKVLHQRAPTGDATLQRLVREAQFTSRVDHPYAVHVYAFGVEDDGLLWIAMELVDGVSLEDWLGAHGPMPIEVFLPFFEHVAQVVQAAHRRGIVHRDLKPSNIMVIESEGSLLPKLLDFGVAKLVDDISASGAVQPSRRPDDSLTPQSWAIGTAGYMAPEQWTDPAHAGPAVDIYALGVLAYETLTGRRPYRGDTVWALSIQHCEGPVPPAPAAIRRALAKRPGDRHDSAVELASELRAEAAAERRRAVARRWGLGAGLVAAVALYGAVQWHAWYEMRLAQQRVAAAQHEARATALTAEVEQGRAALLGGDPAGARLHLGEAWERGDHSGATAFMYARALQPLRSELARLPAIKGRMWSAAWSPDGERIATADDGGAQVWDATTYQLLIPLPHDDTVYAAVWMGDRLVTACGDGAVRIWDGRRGDGIRELRVRGKEPRWYAVAAAGGRVAAVDAAGAIAAVWDAASGKVLAEIQLDGGSRSVAAFSADNRWLAVGGGTTAQIVNTTTWRVDIAIAASRLAWDPTAPRLIVGNVTGEISILGMQGNQRRIREAGRAVEAVAFSPDGTRVAAGLRDGSELVFDVSRAAMVSDSNPARGRLLSIEFSPDGARVLAAASSGLSALSDADTGAPAIVFDTPTKAAYTARFSPDGGRVVAATWDGVAWVWSAAEPYQRWRSPALADGCGLVGGAEPDGRYLAQACLGHPTRIWDTARDQILAELPAIEDGERVPYPAVSSGGDLAAISRGDTAEMYELPGGKLVRSVRRSAPITAVAIADTGELITGAADGEVTTTASGTTRILAAPSGAAIDALLLLPDQAIAAADASGRLRILVAGQVGADVAIGVRARMLRAAPDGHYVLVVPYYSGRAEPMALVDCVRRSMIRLTAPPAYAARWTSAGILSAHADGAARLWTSDGRPVGTYGGVRGFLADVAMIRGMVVAAASDGTLRFWDVTTESQVWAPASAAPRPVGLSVGPWGIVTRGLGGEISRWVLPEADAVIGLGKSSHRLPKTGGMVTAP